MKKLKLFAANVFLLTLVSFLLRAIGVGFNIYVSNRLGAAGMGLFTLIMSVYGFAVTAALSGVNLGSTRLVAEGIGKNSDSTIRSAMKKCLLYGFSFGTVSAILLFTLSYPIGKFLLSDENSIIPLRILSISLPFISISSAFLGYFNAVRRVIKGAAAQVLSQIIRVCITAWFISFLMPKGIMYACAAITLGSVISEGCTCLYLTIMYAVDLKKHNKPEGKAESGLLRKLFSISIPVAFTTYVRSGLVTVEHLLIPPGLRKFGSSGESAVASYGVLCGVVLPVILFPMAFLSSFANLLVPEIAEAKVKGSFDRINYIISRTMQITLIFSIGIAGFMICFSGEIGSFISESPEAVKYIKILAPLIPVMYIDHITDGILKGLGEQLYSMRVNITDAGISCLLVFLLLPHTGIIGYIGIIYFCEILNTALSVVRLLNITYAKTKLFRWLALPLICISLSAFLLKMLFDILHIVLEVNIYSIIFYIVSAGLLYFILLRICGSITKEDMKWVKSIIKN